LFTNLSYSLKRSVEEIKILFAFSFSFSAAVNILVDWVFLPSIAKSNLAFFSLFTITKLLLYAPGSGPSFGSSQDLTNRSALHPNGPSLIPYSSCYWRSSLFQFWAYVFKEQWRGLLISTYVPGPGNGAFTGLLTGRSSVELKAV
jgi:hypothetical protein